MAEKKVAEFSNGTIIVKKEDGTFEKIVPTAQDATKQTQPQDVEGDVDAGVPRDKSVGLDQTDKDYDEYSVDKNVPGDGGSDESVVPRSSGDSGVSGWEKTTFDSEKGEDATSGNPDNYVQKFTPSETPAAAGSPENHAAESDKSDLEATGSTEFETKIAELEKALQKERVLRKREAIARKTIALEVQSGLISGTDEEIETEIASRLVNPSDILEKDYLRVKNLAEMVSSGKIASASSKVDNEEEMKAFASTMIDPESIPNTIGIQSLASVPGFYNTPSEYAPTISGTPSPQTKNNVTKDWQSLSKMGTTLERKNQEFGK